MTMTPSSTTGANTDFTIENYWTYLNKALAAGYRIIPFCEFENTPDRPCLILRHDLDHALEPAAVMAELEAGLGIRATYFIQTHCPFYNLLSPGSRDIIHRLRALGHEIGLHYESHHYVGKSGRDRLKADRRLLEDLSGQRIISAAQHIPIDGDVISLAPEIQNEAYEARFMSGPMDYISDSLMAWRQATPLQLLHQRKSFQFLTHPENWTEPGTDIGELLNGIMEQEIQAVRDRYMETVTYYQTLLAERQKRDQSFRERRKAG